MRPRFSLTTLLPVLTWGRAYDRDTFMSDAVAAVIVTVMLIPQSLAYAMLAGLPPQAGLYASLLPLLAYAIFGSSRVLAVGPVAVVSLMTASALGEVAHADPASYWMMAWTLALISGLMLLGMGVVRLGFLAHFLSYPVIAAFITASGLLIAASQVKTMMGVSIAGGNFWTQVVSLLSHVPDAHLLTGGIGIASLAFLAWSRRFLKPLLLRCHCAPKVADFVSRAAPVFAIVLTTALTGWLGWDSQGVKVVGHIPQGLPPFTLPSWEVGLWKDLFLPAALITLVGFVESVSVGQTLAAKRRQRIDPNQELIALGAGNIACAFTAGFPISGGFARSVVNFDAGAKTPAAGVLTAVGILLASLLFTPALYFLPQATLAATIVIAVLSLVDFDILRRTWNYSKADFIAASGTLLGTLSWGVEVGLVMGVGASLLLFLYRTSQPHMAEVGLVAGTESFRNTLRHRVQVWPHILSLRVDESLYFANSKALEDRINDVAAQRPLLQHVVLQCCAINTIDASALQSLETINQRLRDAGIQFHLSEVKGPVMDRLQRSDLLQQLSGQVHWTHYQAIQAILSSSA